MGTYAAIDEDVLKDQIALPGYPLLADRTVVKELNLTEEQKKKLRQLRAELYGVDTSNFFEGIKNLPQEEQAKRHA